VLGVIKKVNRKEQYRTKLKYTATLCDPIRNFEIDFMLFLNNDEKEISIGMIVILHNFQVYKQNNIYRLNSTYKSYYFEEKGGEEPNDLASDFKRIMLAT
jgi:hypothetical protein